VQQVVFPEVAQGVIAVFPGLGLPRKNQKTNKKKKYKGKHLPHHGGPHKGCRASVPDSFPGVTSCGHLGGRRP
jgi:hypothetical protein